MGIISRCEKKDVTWLLALAALWGGSFPCQRGAVHEFGPVAIAELRIAIGAVALAPALFARAGLKDGPMAMKPDGNRGRTDISF